MLFYCSLYLKQGVLEMKPIERALILSLFGVVLFSALVLHYASDKPPKPDEEVADPAWETCKRSQDAAWRLYISAKSEARSAYQASIDEAWNLFIFSEGSVDPSVLQEKFKEFEESQLQAAGEFEKKVSAAYEKYLRSLDVAFAVYEMVKEK